MGKNKNIEVGNGDSLETPTEQKDMVNLTGHWFVNFGVQNGDSSIEGCRILTLKGNFDPDTLIDILVDALHKDLPQKARDILAEWNLKLVIRAFNRIDAPASVVPAIAI